MGELYLHQGTWDLSVNTTRDYLKLLVLSVLFTKDTLVRLLTSGMTPELPTDEATGLWPTVLGLN